MALETGTYISDLVATNPPGTDLKSQGDDHIRLIKSTVKATFPNITGAVTPTHTELNHVDGVVEAIQTQLDRKSNKNALINGDMIISQRGTSFPAVASAAYTLDMWDYVKVGAVVHTISQDTDVPTVAQALRLIPYSMLIDCTTVDSSIAAGDVSLIEQVIEGFNFIDIAQRPFTLSFWVKATKTGIYCVSFRNSGADRSYIAEYTINASDTWEYKTITVSASPSAGTWDYANGVGLRVAWCLLSGTTFQTTADAWQTGNFVATANQVNAGDNTLNNFRLTGVKCEEGSYDTAVSNKDIGDHLHECQRYYEVMAYRHHGYNLAANTIGHRINFKVKKRDTATITISGAAYTNGSALGDAGDETITGVSLRHTVTATGNSASSATVIAESVL